jgi:aspartyl-tRNA(Asn)/glutamyl-tRNA(Gln) amidotransferase subunit A
VPDTDAIAVARVRAAGGILVGKTATPELAASLQTRSELNGITRNPWSLDRSAGGSSGGAGAATASGLAPLALSTDGAGSSRVPASVCGVVGLKPTLGREPHETWPFHYSNNSSVSINTRTAGDAALLLGVVEGPSLSDPWGARPTRRQDDVTTETSLLLIEDPCGRTADGEILGAVRRTLSGLADLGVRVETADGDPTAFDPAMVPGILGPNLAAGVRSMTDEQQAPLEAPLQQLASPRYRPDAVALQQLEIERSRLYERVDHLLRTYDVIITPTVLSDPPSAETVIEADWWTHLAVANFTGHPAVSIPCGFTELGLPIGLQAIGRWDADQQILDLADRIHSLHPWSES